VTAARAVLAAAALAALPAATVHAQSGGQAAHVVHKVQSGDTLELLGA
jgi:LysM repeat protein